MEFKNDRRTRLIAFCAALWLLCLLLTYIGLSGDIEGWTSELSFASNLLAGATTACFGIPVALSLLNLLYSWQGDLREERAAKRLLFRSLEDLILTADRSVVSERGLSVFRLVDARIIQVLEEFRRIFPTHVIKAYGEPLFSPDERQEWQRWIDMAKKQLETSREELDVFFENDDEAFRKSRTAKLSFIDSAVRARTFAAGVPFIEDEDYLALTLFFGADGINEKALSYCFEILPELLDALSDWDSGPPLQAEHYRSVRAQVERLDNSISVQDTGPRALGVEIRQLEGYGERFRTIIRKYAD